MTFKCPSCGMKLKAEPEHAGKYVRCPGCSTKLQIPSEAPPGLEPPAPFSNLPVPSGVGSSAPGDTPMEETQEEGAQGGEESSQKEFAHRGGWEEQDPTNANMLVSLGIATVATILFLVLILSFMPPKTVASSDYNFMQYLAKVWEGHLPINSLNTLFFFWASAILALKMIKLHHQRQAMLLDVVPFELGSEINAQNVGSFIDHIYSLPEKLRDSLMVNRIRKGLELFEMKQNTGDVVHLMGAQSDIDSARIGTSYTMVKAFLWAIPIVGFVGTVLGLSHALLSLNFENLDDVQQVIGTLKGVINGLGGAFDATLVGLVFATLVNFPMNAAFKAEDDNLNFIDTFCNEVLIPRLNDGTGVAGGDMGAMMDTLVRAVANAQNEFLVDLNNLSATMVGYAENLEKRSSEHQQRVSADFASMLDKMRGDMTQAVTESVSKTTEYTRALSTGITYLNNVLKDLGTKQVVIQQKVKRGWFGRSLS